MAQFKNSSIKAMVVMRKAFRSINSKLADSFVENQLTPTQFSVLEVLYTKGTMKIGELIDNILATSGNMTVVIKNMEKKGWVTRLVCPSDKRAYLVSLTDKGKTIIEKALPEHIQQVEDIFSVLDDKDCQDLIRILKKFKEL